MIWASNPFLPPMPGCPLPHVSDSQIIHLLSPLPSLPRVPCSPNFHLRELPFLISAPWDNSSSWLTLVTSLRYSPPPFVQEQARLGRSLLGWGSGEKDKGPLGKQLTQPWKQRTTQG